MDTLHNFNKIIHVKIKQRNRKNNLIFHKKCINNELLFILMVSRRRRILRLNNSLELRATSLQLLMTTDEIQNRHIL